MRIVIIISLNRNHSHILIVSDLGFKEIYRGNIRVFPDQKSCVDVGCTGQGSDKMGRL